MLQRTACGFGALAFHNLLQAAGTPTSPYANGVAPKAKRVIFLFMQGGPSQIDLFDPKSFINDRHGKSIDSPCAKRSRKWARRNSWPSVPRRLSVPAEKAG